MTENRPALVVSDADLDDLRSRLRATRWPTSWPADAASAGEQPDELQRLATYWADSFDWRAAEAAFNALPHQFAEIDGTPVHYLRFDGETPGAKPIVLTHGWPSTVLELVSLAERLASPSTHGGNPDDAFTVIVPSLPGYVLSPQRPSVLGDHPTHELWHRLMHDVLGFDTYAAHGGDLGAGITSRLADAHPESVIGIHVLAVAGPLELDPATITADEQRFLDAADDWTANEGGYQHQQSTRPVTLAYGLADSPVGLLAWILEKYRAWSDNHGILSTTFTDDFLLTQASLYWFTNTISTSFRPYFEYAAGATGRVTRVTVPTAVALFPADLSHPPRSWAERSYNVVRYTEMPRGGHFAAHEQPELLAADLTEFFRPLR